MKYNTSQTETKISDLSSSFDNLQQKDVFVFSHFKENSGGKDIYDNTKKVQYSTLYSNIMSCLLSDRYFINMLAKELSGIIPSTGTIIYNSAYPENLI